MPAPHTNWVMGSDSTSLEVEVEVTDPCSARAVLGAAVDGESACREFMRAPSSFKAPEGFAKAALVVVGRPANQRMAGVVGQRERSVRPTGRERPAHPSWVLRLTPGMIGACDARLVRAPALLAGAELLQTTIDVA